MYQTTAQHDQEDLKPAARQAQQRSAQDEPPAVRSKTPGGTDPLGKKENTLAPFYDDMVAVAAELAPQFTPLGLHFRPEILLATALQEASAKDPLNTVSFDNGMGITQITPYKGQLDPAVARAINWDNRQSIDYNMQHSNWRNARANLMAGAYTMLGKAQSIHGSVGAIWDKMDEPHRWRAVLFAYNAGQGAAIKALRNGGPNAAMISTYVDPKGNVVSHDYTAEIQQKVDYVSGHDPFGAGTQSQPAKDGATGTGGQTPVGTKDKTTATSQNAPGGAVPTGDLRQGDRGSHVLDLQNGLVKLGYMTRAEVDTGPGIFGPHTEHAVIAFQTASGLPTTGLFGAMSREAMTRALAGNVQNKAGAQDSSGAPPAIHQAIPDAEQAISYATSQTKGSNPIAGSGGTWAYYCLGLVQLAYGERHPGLTGAGDAYSAYQRYSGKAQKAEPDKFPRGALIFWDWTSTHGEHQGHVGICLGGDHVVSTSVKTGGVATTSVTSYGLPFLGWAYP